jgi:integrase
MHFRGRLHRRQLPGLTRPGVYADGAGLYLRVRPSGTRSWIFVCMVKGKRREMGLGSILDVPLAKAREKAGSARAAFLEGRDPIAERAATRTVKAAPTTFGTFADDLIDDIQEGFRNEKHRKQWRSTLKTHATALLAMPITEIDTDAVVEVLKPIWLTKPETASRVRGRIERVLDAAKAKGLRTGENPARWRGHLDLLLPRRPKTSKTHHAALRLTDVGDFMCDLRSRPALAARALEFTILTAARSGETLGMTWAEIDLDRALWTVPAERMKAGVEHQVPLSAQTIAILKAVRPKSVQPSHLVFHSAAGKNLSNMSMSMLLRRMGRDDITVHGFRSTFRDWAGEKTSFPREVVGMALAHTIESKAERAYRRGRSLEKRREVMDAWSRYCATVSQCGQAESAS